MGVTSETLRLQQQLPRRAIARDPYLAEQAAEETGTRADELISRTLAREATALTD